MRILDIAVAAAYGAICISLIAAATPYGTEQGSARAADDARASSAILDYVHSAGLPFLATAPPAQVCSTIEASSNSTMTMGGIVQGLVCAGPPQTFLGSSSLELSLSGRAVTIESWLVAP